MLVGILGGALCWNAQPQLRSQLPAGAPPAVLAVGASRVTHPAMVMTAPITRTGEKPAGPDPFKLVKDDIDDIKASIKKMLSANRGSGSGRDIAQNEVLTMAAREFSARQGKSFRPMLVLLIGRAASPDFVTDVRHFKLAMISEMIHTASLIHSDVLEENADLFRGQGTVVHQEVALDVGNKVCILAGDFLLAKAAVELSLLDNGDVTELVACGLESICEGGMLTFDLAARDSLDAYLHASSQSIGNLIRNCCQCSAILSGHKVDSLVAQGCRVFGEELALAQQLVAEAEEMEALLKACRRSKNKWPSSVEPNAPLLYASDQYPELRDAVTRGFSQPSDAALAIDALERCGAVEHTLELAAEKAQSAAEALLVLPQSAERDALTVLCHKVLSGSPIKGK